MASATVEDYVKAIYALERESPTGEATVARLAASLGVTKGTVTSMVAKLREAKLAKAERYGGIRLTAKGSRLALDVIRRHRLLEVFLVETLGFDWSEVHDEAERLEHAMSAKGKVADSIGEPLSSMPAGARATVLRVSDLDAAFLAFAARHGLKPGAGVTVIDLSPEAQSISVRAAGRAAVSMSLAAAARVTVGRG
jgi:DtxR family Mn-dependent transcriptional regulator